MSVVTALQGGAAAGVSVQCSAAQGKESEVGKKERHHRLFLAKLVPLDRDGRQTPEPWAGSRRPGAGCPC